MTAVRYEITDAAGVVRVADCAVSVPPDESPQLTAMKELRGTPPGWKIRLWRDVPLVGSLESLGDPDVVLTSE